MQNIIYRIPAVRSREQYALASCAKIDEPHSSIFWDEERRGSVWNKFRIWELYKTNPDLTHICMLDDDADVVNNFKDFVQVAAENFPDAILSFCHCNANQVRRKERGKHTPYLLLRNFDFRGISICVPVKYLEGYLKFHREKLYWYKRDDTSLKMYAALQNIPCILTIPNLVRALEIPSAIHPWCQVRNSELWDGYDVDIKQFMTSEYAIGQKLKMFDVHTSQKYPIIDEVKTVYERRIMLSKL